MKRKSIAAWAALAVLSVTLLGCYKSGHRGPGPVTVAKQMCEINALAEERDAIISNMKIDHGRDIDTKDHRYTILKQKLQMYSAEVEASYRFVTANCNSYNLCMAKNHYNEVACADTRKAWVEAHEKFNELAVQIAEIDRGWAPHRRGKGGRHHRGDCRDCRTDGGVFASGCCYQGD